jgi:hypothetical protein
MAPAWLPPAWLPLDTRCRRPNVRWRRLTYYPSSRTFKACFVIDRDYLENRFPREEE